MEESHVLGKPGEFLKVGVVESFPLGYAAVYLGTAIVALDFTTEFYKTRIFKPDTVPISNHPEPLGRFKYASGRDQGALRRYARLCRFLSRLNAWPSHVAGQRFSG